MRFEQFRSVIRSLRFRLTAQKIYIARDRIGGVRLTFLIKKRLEAKTLPRY